MFLRCFLRHFIYIYLFFVYCYSIGFVIQLVWGGNISVRDVTTDYLKFGVVDEKRLPLSTRIMNNGLNDAYLALANTKEVREKRMERLKEQELSSMLGKSSVTENASSIKK